ncbi:MAG: DUF6612 family protein [Actinomycetota bacterium]
MACLALYNGIEGIGAEGEVKMKTSTIRPFLAAVLMVFITTALLSGCGTGGTAFLENPLEFFRRAQENMGTVDSFRMEGKAKADYSDVSDSGSMTMEYEMVYERKGDGEMLVKMEMGVNMGRRKVETLVYLSGDKMYIKTPEGQWVFMEMSVLSSMEDISQGMGPQNMMEMLETADSAEVLEEDGRSITYRLVIDFERLLQGQQDLLDEMKEDFERVPGEMSFDEYTSMMEVVYSNIDYIVAFDKDSGLATEFEFHVDLDMSLLADMFPDDPPPQGARMVMNGVFEIGDYGKVFDLELPGEAEDAIPIEEFEESMQT